MSTTTIRIPDELKERVARAAERTGKSPHSFILEAISEKAEVEERQADFVATAEKRYDAIVASGRRFRGRICVDTSSAALQERRSRVDADREMTR